MQALNRKAKFNYELLDTFEAGIVLTGAEVKSARAGKVNITLAHARVVKNEIFLINTNFNDDNVTQPTRTRKLLLHRKEIDEIEAKMKAKKLTLVPLKLYTTGRLVKVKIALAKPKKKREKREQIKKRDIEREIARELK